VSRLRIAAGTDGGVFVLTSTVEGVDATRAAHLLAEAAARTSWWPVALLQRTLAFGGAWGPPLAGSSEDVSLGSLERGRVAPLPYGPVETAETLLVKLRDQGALVIVDGPPAQRHGDASRLVLAADAVVLVVADDQPIEAALEALEILSLLTTPVLGYIRVSTAQAALAAARRSSAVRDDVVTSGVARVAAATTHDVAVAAAADDAPRTDARTDPADTDIADTPAPATGSASDTDGASDTGNRPDTPGADDAHDTPGTDDADDTAGVGTVTVTPSPAAPAAAVADGENRTRPGMPVVVTRHPPSKDQRLSGAAPPSADGPPGAPAVGATPGPGAGA